MVRAAAAGVGNAVVLMGASTGRDGIGGASVLASAELGEGDEAKRPTVQIGDPFEESKVLECCLELLGEGAAGLAAGPRRRRAHLLGRRDGLGRRGRDRPRRRPGAAARGRHGALRDHGLRVAGADARRWSSRRGSPRCWRSARNGRPGAAEIGVVTDSGQVRVLRGERGRRRDAGRGAGRRLPALRPRAGRAGGLDLRQPGDARRRAPRAEETLLALLASPSIASKRWAFEQYDSVVGSRTVRRPESADAAVLQLPEAGNAIAVSIDGNGRRVACDPYAGTVEAVLECAQNLACVGAEPLGLTNCLNFGNPEKPAAGLAARPRGQRPRRRLRGARRPGRRRQRLPLQRGAGRPDLPDPGGRHGRRAARPGAGRRQRLRPRGRRDRPARPLRPVARRLGAGEAARRARRRACPSPTSPRSPPPARRSATRSAPASSPPPTTSATAASPAPWPSRRSAPASAAGSTSSPCASAAAPPRRRCSARAPAGFSSAATAHGAAKRWTTKDGDACSSSARSAANPPQLDVTGAHGGTGVSSIARADRRTRRSGVPRTTRLGSDSTRDVRTVRSPESRCTGT